MGKRTVILMVCDKCGKELVGRLTFRTCPCCGKDVCLSCIEKENAKHRPRERKPKTEPVSTPPAEAPPEPVPLTKGRWKKKIQEEPEIADKKGENLTIHVPTGLEGDTEYEVDIAGSEATGPTLRLTVSAALEEFNGKIPDQLTKEEKALIQGILDT